LEASRAFADHAGPQFQLSQRMGDFRKQMGYWLSLPAAIMLAALLMLKVL
jgi:hypothetical protein